MCPQLGINSAFFILEVVVVGHIFPVSSLCVVASLLQNKSGGPSGRVIVHSRLCLASSSCGQSTIALRLHIGYTHIRRSTNSYQPPRHNRQDHSLEDQTGHQRGSFITPEGGLLEEAYLLSYQMELLPTHMSPHLFSTYSSCPSCCTRNRHR